MNRNSVLWLGFLWLAAAVMAFAASPVKPVHKARTSSVLVSPTNKVVMAKIAPTATDGRQVLVSYNGGKSFDQITWPIDHFFSQESAGQATTISWSKTGLLAIEFMGIAVTTNPPTTQNDAMFEQASVGVFDPVKKMIYWLNGPLGQRHVYSSESATKPQWIGPNRLKCHVIMISNHYEATTDVTIKIDNQFIDKFHEPDPAPFLTNFANTLIKIASSNGDIHPLLAKVVLSDRADMQKYIGEHKKYFRLAQIISAYRLRENNNLNLGTITIGYKLPDNNLCFICGFIYNPKTKLLAFLPADY